MASLAAASTASSSSKRLAPVLLITHKACSEHLIKDHPEQPKRVGSIVNALISSFKADELVLDENPPQVTQEQLLRFHTKKHVSTLFEAFEKVAKNKKNTPVHIDGDTTVMKATAEACFRAAGGAVYAVDSLLGPNPIAKSCFVAVRPPGHHAEPDTAMGFCFFGNAGIAALHAREVYGVKKIAILDWDVHHGNGTQAKFETDPDTFFASSHQMPCYPGTGFPKETGVNGNVVNCALPPGSGSSYFRAAWKDTIIPKLIGFKPQFIIVSAGFDAHHDDPLAELRLKDDDFYFVQSLIMKATPNVPLMSMLEGGYNLKAIARSAVQCVRAQVEACTRDGSEEIADLVTKLDISSTGEGAGVDAGADIGASASGSSVIKGDEKSLLDQIYAGYERCLSQGMIRSDPTATLSKLLLGESSFVVAFDVKHFAAKRPTQIEAVSMKQPFNPDKFNFNKANTSETVAEVKSTAKFATNVLSLLPLNETDSVLLKDHVHPILVNVSPLMVGHCVVPLWCEQGQPQLLYTPLHLAAACEVALVSGSVCRIGFNSLGAFASINHLHLHIMPIDNDGVGLPIENAPVLKCLLRGSDAAVNILNWCVPCFSFEARDPCLAVAMVWTLLNMLVSQEVPYNLLFVTNSETHVKILAIPRKPQQVFDPSFVGFNGAVCELCGLLIANSQEKFDELTQSSASESMAKYAGLGSEQVKLLSTQLVEAISANSKLSSYVSEGNPNSFVFRTTSIETESEEVGV